MRSAILRALWITGLTIAATAGDAAAQSIAPENIRQLTGCWETFGAARDARSVCFEPTGRVTIATHRSGNGGRCGNYPASPVRVAAGEAIVDVAAGSGNCQSAEGVVGNSVPGRFACDLDSGREHLVCRTTWSGWEPITEVYRRRP